MLKSSRYFANRRSPFADHDTIFFVLSLANDVLSADLFVAYAGEDRTVTSLKNAGTGK